MLYSAKLSNLYSDLSNEELQRINKLINELPLPELKNINIEKILNLINHDKKTTANGLNFILLNKIGSAQISNNIS